MSSAGVNFVEIFAQENGGPCPFQWENGWAGAPKALPPNALGILSLLYNFAYYYGSDPAGLWSNMPMPCTLLLCFFSRGRKSSGGMDAACYNEFGAKDFYYNNLPIMIYFYVYLFFYLIVFELTAKIILFS
jgi:hypothetical protein